MIYVSFKVDTGNSYLKSFSDFFKIKEPISELKIMHVYGIRTTLFGVANNERGGRKRYNGWSLSICS